MCLAHEELRRGVAQDCWQAAVTVGRQAAAVAHINLNEAYTMCPCASGARRRFVICVCVALTRRRSRSVRRRLSSRRARSLGASAGDVRASAPTSLATVQVKRHYGDGDFVGAASLICEQVPVRVCSSKSSPYFVVIVFACSSTTPIRRVSK